MILFLSKIIKKLQKKCTTSQLKCKIFIQSEINCSFDFRSMLFNCKYIRQCTGNVLVHSYAFSCYTARGILLPVLTSLINAILNFSNPRGLTSGSIKWSSMNGYRGQATVIRKFGEVENGV